MAMYGVLEVTLATVLRRNRWPVGCKRSNTTSKAGKSKSVAPFEFPASRRVNWHSLCQSVAMPHARHRG